MHDHSRYQDGAPRDYTRVSQDLMQYDYVYDSATCEDIFLVAEVSAQLAYWLDAPHAAYWSQMGALN